MPSTSKPLDIESIKTSTNCEHIHYFESLNSTNSWLLEHGQCGDICISDQQSAGRGRRGNVWVSPNGGNIYLSQCWCFDSKIKHWSLLGLVTGIAIAEALEDIGLKKHGIKWPNDIFYQQQKLGGILLETTDQSGKVIIGIGINVELSANLTKEIGQPVTSINEVLKDKFVSRESVIIALINRIEERLSQFSTLDFEQFLDSWKLWDILQDKQVSFDHQGITVVGKVIKLDEHGRLGILKNSGVLSYYSSADIKLAKGKDSK